ncbi:MAG: hypothetical protein AVDCRST_MAG20-1306 [uncultured Acidimicrobiales bacterium]|uniref:Uncharacterized protein n=1 Tax=uncultured Acidimicrobiales bacterium TaxID=310071 RepID=A0A6J4HV03_9ACTN|nr:MAG: hypothetical protein AVDCRST_MAG20-1306 [uncultured Acidimicrobiales bacterium]
MGLPPFREVVATVGLDRLQQLVRAHADQAVQPPRRDLQATVPARLPPGQRVVERGVDERAVDVEQGCGRVGRLHRSPVPTRRGAGPMYHRASRRTALAKSSPCPRGRVRPAVAATARPMATWSWRVTRPLG